MPLHVAFVWHQHQPLYKDYLSGQYLLPWVRLHAIKDYLDLPRVLHNFPTLHQTFNLVPSLLLQLDDYASGRADDRYSVLASIPPYQLSAGERAEIVHRFFDLNWERMVYPHGRYAELAHKREELFQRHHDYRAVASHFSDQEILDLTVCFHLAWTDPLWKNQIPELRRLAAQGRDYSEQDRRVLKEVHRRLIAAVVPEHRDLQAAGQIELTTSPFYHPILPLLCDWQSAREARPDLPLPEGEFRHPEDARQQLESGLRLFEATFGQRPRGIWPSEQSVSHAVVGLLEEVGCQWTISDEGVLARSLGRPLRGHGSLHEDHKLLYQPYRVGHALNIVFRDRVLSDLIGFHYARMEPETAARDFHQRLIAIYDRVGSGLVTVALDGENCWEYYPNDGHDFLQALYSRLAEDGRLKLVTVSEGLHAVPATQHLPHLHAGSWIEHDFTTWIGEPTKNKAWKALAHARQRLAQSELPDDVRQAAWEELYVAEGSDWFWWFGDGHSSDHDALFDEQFRHHLANIYMLLEEPLPDTLRQSLYPEGGGGHVYVFGGDTGTMHQGAPLLTRLAYGVDGSMLRVRWRLAADYVPSPDDRVELRLPDRVMREHPTKGEFALPISQLPENRVRFVLAAIGDGIAAESPPLDLSW